MELLKLALRNLTRRRVRTSLTVLGVTVAIAFTVGLLSISEGFIITTNRSMAQQGEHILVLPEEMAFHPLPLLEALGSYIPEGFLERVREIENVSLFVLSTMMMAVSKRVEEIGVLRALGASRGLVFRLILSESIIIGLGAGILGCAGGYGLSRAIAYGVSVAMGEGFLQPMITPRILIIGLTTSLLVGAIAGLYPAWRISRINIVEALRYE